MTPNFMKATLSAALVTALLGSAAFAQEGGLTVTFTDPAWDGVTIPEGQHCSLQGGEGATPEFEVSGLPEGTTQVNVAFSDESFEPMSNGGHGTIGFAVAPVDGVATLQSVAGETEEFPAGVTLAEPNRTGGDFLRPGYMPPCSGGNDNLYTATVSALDDAGEVLATGEIELGRY